MTKSDTVRKLLHLPNAEIVERTGFHDAFIRAVRQRTDANGKRKRSSADTRYHDANAHSIRSYQNNYRRHRYREDPEYRARTMERNRKNSRACYWRKKEAEYA